MIAKLHHVEEAKRANVLIIRLCLQGHTRSMQLVKLGQDSEIGVVSSSAGLS